MKSVLLILASVLCIYHTALAQKTINVIALERGATMVKTPNSRVPVTDRVAFKKYSAGALFDQSPNVWSSDGVRFPFVFVMELVEEFNVQKLIFDNRCEFYPGIETKKVQVEFSTESAEAGFKNIGEYILEKEKLNQFSVPPQKTRWIRLTILENYGNREWVQLAEFKVLGVPGNRIGQTVDINGVWHTNWQDMTFVQEGSSFTGKYIYTSEGRKYKGKVKDGKISRNSIAFKWDEGNANGTANLFLNQEGNKISGFWRNANHAPDFNLWSMSRKAEETKAIEYSEEIEPEVVEEEIIEEPIVEATAVATPEPTPETVTETPSPSIPTPETVAVQAAATPPPVTIGDIDIAEIKAGEAIVMDNIIFKQGAASVSPESRPELNILYEYLASNKNAKIIVNGHTDKIGDPKKNVLLSQARANSIKKYLVAKGINKNRIKAVGLGDTKTLCPPPCVKNRRVDFVVL